LLHRIIGSAKLPNGAFRQEKAVLYPDYAEQNRLKGIFSAFAEYLKTL
jgi:hypothetical protein